MRKKIVNPVSIIFIGLCIGVLVKWIDLHTHTIGNIFSQLPIWILLAVLIAIYSKDEIQAMFHVLLFSLSMLNSYFVCTEIWNTVYGVNYTKGWSLFVFGIPLFAYFAWISKEKGMFPKIIAISICFVSIILCMFIYNMNIVNLVINTILIYFMLLVEVERNPYDS